MNKLIVCVTGAGGFIGKQLVKSLLKTNYRVRVMLRERNTSGNFFDELSDISYFYGDLVTDKLVLKNFLLNCDVIINCAAEINRIELMKSVNTDVVHKLIGACKNELLNPLRSNKNIHIIQLSSVGVYGATSHIPNRVFESAPLAPIGPYEKSKAEADLLIQKIGYKSNLKWTIIRPSNVIGVGMKNSHLIPLIASIRKGQFFFIGSNFSIATYIAIDDVIDLLITCIDDVRSRYQIFNISNDIYMSIFINNICKSLGRSDVKIRIPRFPMVLLCGFLNIIFKTPLSYRRINALSSCTSYPFDKLINTLSFKPSNDILKIIHQISQNE